MLGVLLILIFVAYLVFFYPIFDAEEEPVERSQKYKTQMNKLWSIAQTSMKERKPLRAEKALLTILKFDEKNAAAYNRLGILYAKGQKYNEAIECFEIAQSLDSNASSLHNVGLIYLETGEYEKAAMAFRQALKLEGDLPARFIALSKAEEKMGQRKNAIESLESAYDLDHSVATLRQILAIHEAANNTSAIEETTARIEKQMAENAAQKEETKKEKRKPVAKSAIARSRMPLVRRKTKTKSVATMSTPSKTVIGPNRIAKVKRAKTAAHKLDKPKTLRNRKIIQ